MAEPLEFLRATSGRLWTAWPWIFAAPGTVSRPCPCWKRLKLKDDNGWPTEFVHQVPVARIEGTNIVTGEGLDSPLFRYNLYRTCGAGGWASSNYYVVGWDSLTASPLASLGGHLGRLDNRQFLELMTKTLYFNPGCTDLGSARDHFQLCQAHDGLTGSSVLRNFWTASTRTMTA